MNRDKENFFKYDYTYQAKIINNIKSEKSNKYILKVELIIFTTHD